MQPVDALRHLGVEDGRDVRQADPAAVAGEAAVIGHLVDHPTKLRVLEGQRRRPRCRGGGLRPAAARRARRAQSIRRSTDSGCSRWNFAERCQHEPLGHASLLGVDRPDRHAAGVPSIAIRIAWVSSSDRLCAESPSRPAWRRPACSRGRGAS